MRCLLWRLLWVICSQVNRHDVTSVADDVAMTVLRSSPRRLSMTLGRAVTNLVAPPSCDSLPDIVLHKTPSGQLGGSLRMLSHILKTHIVTSQYLHYLCFFPRYKVDRRDWQQMAGHLLSGGGARFTSQRGGQCPTQWQDPLHLWPLHTRNDPGGRSQSLWGCPS